jgi:hypothetical protein
MAREPMVIRARVRAWLLGIRLLTLDAHITATSDGGLVLTIPAAGSPRSPRQLAGSRPSPAEPGAGPDRSASYQWSAEPVPGSSVARARQLVEQGTLALEQGRRPAPGRQVPGGDDRLLAGPARARFPESRRLGHVRGSWR